MQIDKELNVAVVVKRAWANLHAVKMFFRPEETTRLDIRGVDESHIIFAKVLDCENATGVWIEVEPRKQTEDSRMQQFRILIPWSEVLAVVVGKEFSPAIRQEARKIGFTGETESE
jgi:hypothetical protein